MADSLLNIAREFTKSFVEASRNKDRVVTEPAGAARTFSDRPFAASFCRKSDIPVRTCDGHRATNLARRSGFFAFPICERSSAIFVS